MKKTSLFVTCIIDQLVPEVGLAVTKILRNTGYSIDFPFEQTCCGQPLFNSGFTKKAKLMAENTIYLFKNSISVVIPSGSCTAMIRNFYPDLFKNDPNMYKDALNLANKTFEFTEFLTKHKLQIPSSLMNNKQKKIAYHPSCHSMRELGIQEEPIELLKKITNITLVPIKNSQNCCGFGGTFSIKYPEISEKMLSEKIEAIKTSKTKIITSCDMSCLMHIGGALKKQKKDIKPLHIAQILAGEE